MNEAVIDAQVLIVGAGPVGLLLACELTQADVRVVVVDRLAEPMTESRASQLTSLTAELLDERGFRGLLDEAQHEPTAHFGGLPFRLDGVGSAFEGHWKVPQYRTEAILGERAVGRGAQVLRDLELTRITQHRGHVECEVEGTDGSRLVHAEYVVGCDGATSTVRRLAGFPVTATEATRELLRADVRGLDIRSRRFERLRRGFATAVTQRGVTRVMVHVFGGTTVPRSVAPDFTEVAEAWQRVTGEDIAAGEPVWVDAFDNATGHVEEYRRGRTLLAGDSAHWHLPIGGQALNLGLQDAVSLGWRLAAAIHGRDDPESLEPYGTERRPVVARSLDHVAAQELLLLGGPDVEPLRSVVGEIIDVGQARLHLAKSASNLGPREQVTGRSSAGGRGSGSERTRTPPVAQRPASSAHSDGAPPGTVVRHDDGDGWRAGEQSGARTHNKLMCNGR